MKRIHETEVSQGAKLIPVHDLSKSSSFDCTIVLVSSLKEDDYPGKVAALAASNIDDLVGKKVTLHQADVPGKRLVLSPIGPVNRDLDDVRSWYDSARAGVLRAKQAGSHNPIIILSSKPDIKNFPEYKNALSVSLLGAFQELYASLQARETKGLLDTEPIQTIGYHCPWISSEELTRTGEIVQAIETGRRLARDLGDSDPERMAPVRYSKYLEESFKGYPVKVTTKSNTQELEREYPLLMAVSRASRTVERHLPRVIHLEYNPEGEVKETLFLVGKGVTYDSGGLDIKTGGHMAGMSRDKCGASNIAGVLLTCALLKPRNIRVVAELGIVRNSVDSEGYAADEVIIGHSGVRVKIMNTDAEGRLVLADCLSHLRQQALNEKAPNPHFFSMATLTGHAQRSIGNYTAIVDNGPAQAIGQGIKLKQTGEIWADCSELSTPRKEDLKSITKDDPSFDVMQVSLGTSRGHQYAAVFLTIASGLDKHGRDSSTPIPYSHLDIIKVIHYKLIKKKKKKFFVYNLI